jgi:anti-sigma B factor antagonist
LCKIPEEAVVELTAVRLDPDVTHLALAGRMDAAGMQGVEVKFTGYTAARRKPTLVDLSRVEFIASLGIGMLVSCAKALQRHGVPMVLLNPSDPVEKVLRTTGIDQVIPIVHDLEEGFRLLAPGA